MNTCGTKDLKPFGINRCTKTGGWGVLFFTQRSQSDRRAQAIIRLATSWAALTGNCQLKTVNFAFNLYFFPYRWASRIFLRFAASRYLRFSSAVLGTSGGSGLGCPVTSSMATNVA